MKWVGPPQVVSRQFCVRPGINRISRDSYLLRVPLMGTPANQALVQRLVDEHYVALYRYAYRLSGAAAQAEDLTQETYCKAQLNLGQLRDQGRAKPWLFRILRNAYLHKVRTEKQQMTVCLDGVGDLPERLPDP